MINKKVKPNESDFTSERFPIFKGVAKSDLLNLAISLAFYQGHIEDDVINSKTNIIKIHFSSTIER